MRRLTLFLFRTPARARMMLTAIISGFLWGVINDFVLGRREERVTYEVAVLIGVIFVAFMLFEFRKHKTIRHLFWLLLLLLSACGSAQAGPNPFSRVWHWAGHHKRFLAMEGAAIGASAVNFSGLHHCRVENGPEPCIGKYGGAYAIAGTGAGLTIVIMPAATEGCWKGQEEGDSFLLRHCGLMTIATDAVSFGFGIQQFAAHAPRSFHETTAPSLAFRLRH
jgi:hypothetical protein